MSRRLILRAVLLVVWASTLSDVRADHALDFFPSYYPHEIKIEVMDPTSAAKRLSAHAIHAHVGRDPFVGRAVPADLGHVESLQSYVVLTPNPSSPALAARAARCAAARTLGSSLASRKGGWIFHPYPVTPFHADYHYHFDLVASARPRYRPGAAEPGAPLRLKAEGSLARDLVPAPIQGTGPWDAAIEEIDLQDLVASARTSLNGWLGPPWIKEGWFHAYLLHAGTVADGPTKRDAETIYQRLVRGLYGDALQRVNLERALVSRLGSGCERVVLGYTVRREYFNTSDYSEGVENIAYDSQSGFTSPIFLRTVKLKDFLWNGWLRLGVQAKPSTAWNPLGGFADATGRLIWAALGDPAQLPHPTNSTWIANRVTTPTVTFEGLPSGGVEVPSTALSPDPGTGMLRPVGEGTTARAKILYRVLLSTFHDGTSMGAADILYAYAFAYRWGVKSARSGADYDPLVDASTVLLREWLAGIRLLGVEQETRESGETKYLFRVQPVEVYLAQRLADLTQVAAVAPPWSTLPWHVVALMEEAVTRHLAAFSQDEARRRRLPWLDLVRDQSLKARLASLVVRFGREGYVPPSLRGLVTPAEASARWTALQRFYTANRHFLVTNGPYRLHRWSGSSVTLQAFRDVTYPLGLGLFNDYPLPRRAYITGIELRGDRLEVRGDVERVLRFQRTYTITREPLKGRGSEIDPADLPVCRYVVVSQDGAIADLGNAPYTEAGSWSVELTGITKPGLYTVVVGLFLGGNEVNPDLKTIEYRAEGRP